MPDAITLKSGHTLELRSPDFGAAKNLAKAIARELRSVDVQLESMDIQAFLAKDVNAIKNVFLQVGSSDVVEQAVYACAVKSLLNGQKITPNLFEPEDMRQDYLPVVWEVMKFSLAPFFASLEFPSSAPAARTSSSPK